MTVDTMDRAKKAVEEMCKSTTPVMSVWQYVHRLTGQTVYAIFTTACYCDVSYSPFVSKPLLIYLDGRWLGKYLFMNKVV